MNTHYSVSNPYSQQTLAQYRYTQAGELAAVLAQLKQGQHQQRQLSAFQRADILRQLAQLLEQHSEQLAAMITAETGKTISDARIEMGRAINTALASSDEARQITGEVLDSDAYPPTRQRLGIVHWQPIGTVLCITPFNFPINLALHKIGPAFAAGNCILLKPSPANTASSQLLTELCHRAGMPEDVIQMRVPAIADMAALIAHPLVNAINFTGGTAAAAAIASAAGYKKMLLELGGNDPLIVMPDADLAAAVSATINQRFASAGQRCTAAKRVFVQRDVYEEFRQRLLTACEAIVVGDPADDKTLLGPVIHSAAADEIEQRIQAALKAGATLLMGNRREGNIIYPTIIENVPEACALIAEETFGPVVPLIAFDHIDEVIEQVNRSQYGLQAGVFSNDMQLIKRLFNELEVGTVIANDGPGFRADHFPFGGVKASGLGREGVKYAIREMSVLKTLVI